MKLDAPRRQVYIAEKNGTVYGVAYYYMGPEENIAYFSILVADPYQRKGYGGLFIDFLEQEASEAGFRAFRTSGGTRNQGPLYNLLIKKGYTNLGNYGGDNVTMEKKLY